MRCFFALLFMGKNILTFSNDEEAHEEHHGVAGKNKVTAVHLCAQTSKTTLNNQYINYKIILIMTHCSAVEREFWQYKQENSGIKTTFINLYLPN